MSRRVKAYKGHRRWDRFWERFWAVYEWVREYEFGGKR